MKTILSILTLTACLALCSCDSPTVLRIVDATPGVLDALGKYNVLNEAEVTLGKEALADGRELVVALSPQAPAGDLPLPLGDLPLPLGDLPPALVVESGE